MFIGRDEELQALRTAIQAREPRLAVIYGRRRIGKTSLIRQSVGRELVIFIEGLENQPTQDGDTGFGKATDGHRVG